LELELRWLVPVDLIDGSGDKLVYTVSDIESIPDSPDIYAFARTFWESVIPLYIGQAINLRTRIWQQINNKVKLMKERRTIRIQEASDR
jgi:excinuclease UvrABC nuclease subunit